MSWNGVHGKLGSPKAPRGCLGHHLSIDVAAKVVSQFIPGDDAASRKAWLAKGAGEVEDGLRTAGAEVLHEAMKNDRFTNELNGTIANLIWFLACLYYTLLIKTRGFTDLKFNSTLGYGWMSVRYMWYLVSQCGYAICSEAGAHSLAAHCMVQAASGYYGCGLVALNYHLSKRSADSTAAAAAAASAAPSADFFWALHWNREAAHASPFFAARRWLARFTVVVHVLIVAVTVAPIDGYDDAIIGTAMAMAFYGPAAAAGMLTLLYFWLSEAPATNPDAVRFSRALFVGVIGGFFGLIDLAWPSMSFAGAGLYFGFFRAVSDSLLYVPFVTAAVLLIDRRIEAGPRVGLKVGSKRTTVHSDTKRQAYDYTAFARRMIPAVLLLLAASRAYTTVNAAFYSSDLCFDPADLSNHADECGSGANYIAELDPHTRAVYGIMKRMLNARDQELPGPDTIAVPTAMYGNRKMLRLPLADISVPAWDEDNPGQDWGFNPSRWPTVFADSAMVAVVPRVFGFLNMPFFNPMVDNTTDFEDLELGQRILRVATKEDLAALELHPWEELTSDEAISHFTFAGLAAHRLRKVAPTAGTSGDGIAFVNDWSWLHPLEHRAGYERYGAAAYFDSNATLVKIYWDTAGKDIYPGDADWEHAKWVYKSTVLVGTTVKDHLLGVHFMASNFMATSAVTNLHPTHPIRRLIKPHTYGASSINKAAVATLSTEFSFVHHATSLTWKGMATAFQVSYDALFFDDISHYLQSTRMDTVDPEIYPFGQDLAEFVQIVQAHVVAYVDIYYADDAAASADKELQAFWRGLRRQDSKSGMDIMLTTKAMLSTTLTHFIVHVTGIHNHVGNIADYFADPTFVSGKLRAGKEVADVQASFQGVNIALATANKQPKLINDFKHLLLNDTHLADTSEIFDTFQAKLVQLAAAIDSKNEARRFPCNSFNPRTMVSSVSI